MRLSFLTFVVASVCLFAVGTFAQVSDNPYTTLQIVDGSNFCTFLPPASSEDRNIASTEYMANVFCTGSTPKAKPAGTLSEGFILSAHYVSTADYVQITGQINPSKMNLNVSDDGGQYDVVMPTGATCVGWGLFVNLIEPSGYTYCIRCCNSKDYCNRGISQKGCAGIIPGDYSGPASQDANGNMVINGVVQTVGGSTPSASVSPAQSSVAASSKPVASSNAATVIAGTSTVTTSAKTSSSASSKTTGVLASVMDDSGGVTEEGIASGLHHVGVHITLASLCVAVAFAFL